MFIYNVYLYMSSKLVFLGGSVVKNPPAKADLSSVPGLGRVPGERHGNTFQYSYL